jgi:hypothetical protein
MRWFAVIVLYLAAAAIVEMAILPPAQASMPGWLGLLFLWRPLVIGVLVAGLLRGEISGLGTAIVAAMLFGFLTDPSYLGAAVVSFSIVGFLAGLAARQFRFSGWAAPWGGMVLLLLAETLIWSLTRKLFWSDAPLTVGWPAILESACLGVVLFRMAPKSMRRNLYEED